MNLEKAAQALVECGYAVQYGSERSYGSQTSSAGWYVVLPDGGQECVDHIYNEAQRQALIKHYKICRVWKIYSNANPFEHWWVWSGLFQDKDYIDKNNPVEAENACLEEILK